jgi:heat shock protein HslJ
MKNPLAIAAAALVLGACAMAQTWEQSKEPPPKPFVGTRWQVILELPLAGEQPYIRMGDGRLEGFGGCNRINARYLSDAVGARAIAFTAMSTSKRMCDPSTMAAEQRVVETLQFVSSYTITGSAMTMSGSSGTLKLLAVEPSK